MTSFDTEVVLPFPVRRVFSDYASKACRIALKPLFDIVQASASAADLPKPAGKLGEMRRAFALTIDAWRQRLAELAAAGWPRVQTPQSFAYAANCLPAACSVPYQRLRACRQRQVCPWCWCRQYVQTTFHRFHRVLYGSTSRGKEAAYGLVEVYTDRYYPIEGPFAWSARDPASSFVCYQKGNYVRQVFSDTPGAAVLCSLDPVYPESSPPCWRLRHRVLALVRHDDTRDFYREPQLFDAEIVGGVWARRHVTPIPAPTRSDLVLAVGRYAAYPVGLWVGEAGRALEAIRAVSAVTFRDAAGKLKKQGGVRCSALYGELRGT